MQHENCPQVAQQYSSINRFPLHAHCRNEHGNTHGHVGHQDQVNDGAPQRETLKVLLNALGEH